MVFAVDAFLHPLQVDRPDRGRSDRGGEFG